MWEAILCERDRVLMYTARPAIVKTEQKRFTTFRITIILQIFTLWDK